MQSNSVSSADINMICNYYGICLTLDSYFSTTPQRDWGPEWEEQTISKPTHFFPKWIGPQQLMQLRKHLNMFVLGFLLVFFVEEVTAFVFYFTIFSAGIVSAIKYFIVIS